LDLMGRLLAGKMEEVKMRFSSATCQSCLPGAVSLILVAHSMRARICACYARLDTCCRVSRGMASCICWARCTGSCPVVVLVEHSGQNVGFAMRRFAGEG